VLALIGEARAAGRTVIFSSHVLSEIERIADRVVILRSGRLVHDQPMQEIRRGHRIRARLTAALPPVPDHLSRQVSMSRGADGRVTIDAPGDLVPLLSWLATLPLADVHIEPIGLQAVYEQYHPAEIAV
jgi:ABC-2 type transport system ATP-binding protein